ncbi:MAG: dihydropteroate synthase [Desulfococcaceae bacterium]
MKQYTISWTHQGREWNLRLGERTCVMGILNVTPDSFSDGGIFFDFEKALAQAEKMVGDGTDILDIGGESTRPFSEEVSVTEEIRRVVPVIEKLVSGKIPVPISIDTAKAEVAKQALDAGASIINDISALQNDPEMASLAAEYRVPVIMMHMKGTPKTMQVDPHYDDLLGELHLFFEQAICRAVKSGIERSKIIIDPGIGFGKTKEHNLCLIRRLDAFADLDVPILVGSSRKAFIRNLLKKEGEKDINPLSPIVETGTQASVAASVLSGAHIVRVHNVANTRATVRIADAIRNV